MQVLYLIMMYIAAYPMTLSVLHSNMKDKLEDPYYEPNAPGATDVRTQAKRLIFRDVFFLVVLFFVICLSENSNLRNNANFSLWGILFEIVSAYGTVGLSLGFPGILTSFSTEWHPFSRFLLVIVMIMGRHRGLPMSVDRAILIPKVENPDTIKEVELLDTFSKQPIITTSSPKSIYDI